MSSSQQAKAPLFSGLFRVRKSQDCPDRAEKPKHAGTASAAAGVFIRDESTVPNHRHIEA